jgi:hypothetical protein
LGKEDIERWRNEMEEERSQAQRLDDALRAGAATGDYTTAHVVYEEVAADVRTKRKSERISLLLRFGGRETRKLNPFFEIMSLCLTNVKAGLPLDRLDFATWLALGGRHLLNGHMDRAQFGAFRKTFEEAVASLARTVPPTGLLPTCMPVDADRAQAVFLKARYGPQEDKEFGQRTGGGITVGKTEGETRAATLGRRQERSRKTRRELMINERRAATNALCAAQQCRPEDNPLALHAAYEQALAAIGVSAGGERPDVNHQPVRCDSVLIPARCGSTASVAARPPSDAAISQRQFSGLLYWAQVAGLRAIDSVIPANAEPERLEERRAMRDHLLSYLGSGVIDAKAYKDTVTSDLIRLAELVGERLTGLGLTRETMTDADREAFVGLAKVGELCDISLLLALEYEADLAGPGQERNAAANGLFTFFDQTMNVHHFDYLPFLLQPGLSDGILERWFTRAEKLRLACDRHRWLYGRIRKNIVQRTSLADKTPDYQALWLGDVSDWQHPEAWHLGLGVNVDTERERFWFSYARLRDSVAMMRELMNLNNPSTLNGMPEIFSDVSPALLGAEPEGDCTNLLSVYPYGNTTMLVALEQGAALEREGYNFMLCPFPEMRHDPCCGRTFLRAKDALMYVSGERYQRLLLASGADAERARKIAARVPPQGVLIALRFAEPLEEQPSGAGIGHGDAVIAHGAFFHFTQPLRGDVDHAAVALIQPIGAEALTYLKSAVPQILAGTGVPAPAGFTWSMDDTERAEESARETLAPRLNRQPSAVEIGRNAEAQIRNRLWAMLEKYPFVTEIIEKPEKESGGRGSEVLPILSRTSRDEGTIKLYGSRKTDPEDIGKEIRETLDGSSPAHGPEGMRNLQHLASLIYQTSKKDNVVVQGLVHSHVRMLYTRSFLENIVARRARRGQSTSLNLDPQTRLFGYFRYILSRGTDEEFRNPESTSHRICVISGEAIGNAARPGSTLDVYRDEVVNPEFREPLRRALDAAFYESSAARRRYLRAHWPRVLREYLVVNQRFGNALQANLASVLRGRCGALAEQFVAAHAEWAAVRGRLETFLGGWVERLFGIDERGRDFTAAVAADCGDMAAPLIQFLGSYLEEIRQLHLDIHYTMDDGMPMYLGDDKRDYRYVVARDEQGNIRLDDWGNLTLLPLADPQGKPTAVELFDKDGRATLRTGPDGKAAPVAIFETVDGEVRERELYDRDVSRMSQPEREKFRVSCLLGTIIEFNPGAGLWRLYDLELQKLDARRGGEGVLGIFRPLGQRARQFKEASPFPRSFAPAVAAERPGRRRAAYCGSGDALFTEKVTAQPGTWASLVEIAAAKAREDMNQGATYRFRPDDMGLLLSYAATESLFASQNKDVAQSLGRDRVASAVNAFLSQQELASVLQERLELAEDVQLAALLSSSSYRATIGSLVHQCLQSGAEGTALRVAAETLGDAQVAILLGDWKNCGLVFEGSEIAAADTVAAFQMDADRHFGQRRGLNFLGVRADWLTPDGKAARETLMVDAGGLVRKVVFATPVRLQMAGVLGLNAATEQATHRALSDLFQAARIPVMNPYGTAATTLDSKSLTHARCAGVVDQPLQELIDLRREAEEPSRKASLEAHLREILDKRGVSTKGQKTVKVVIKPDRGTEGVLARSFCLRLADGKISEGDELSATTKHLAAIRQAGLDAVAEEERGNVTYDGGKRVVLRVNVCETPDGFRADTGFARVAGKPGDVIVSHERGATTEDINKVLVALERNGQPLRACLDSASLHAVITDTVSALTTSARRAAEALQIQGIAGLDFVLEADSDRDGNIRMGAVFLEANARPALLSAAREIMPDLGDAEEGVAESALLLANPGFFDVLYARAVDFPSPPRPDVAATVAKQPKDTSLALVLRGAEGWGEGQGSRGRSCSSTVAKQLAGPARAAVEQIARVPSRLAEDSDLPVGARPEAGEAPRETNEP